MFVQNVNTGYDADYSEQPVDIPDVQAGTGDKVRKEDNLYQ